MPLMLVRFLILASSVVLLSSLAVGADSVVSGGSLLTARADHNSVLLNNGKVLVVGGATMTSGGATFVTTAELYDPATGVATATGAPLYHHHHGTLTLLPNGKVLFAAGIVDTFGASFPSGLVELYDPATGAWTSAAGTSTAHWRHTATLLPNGKVLVVGTDSSQGFNTRAELYDPAANSWVTTGSLTTGRYHHTATLLANGKVLVVGGEGTSNLASAELYDPSAGTWSAAGSLTTARRQHTAVLLPNGKVLVAGGTGSGTLASAELYDPGTNSWTGTGTMAAGRYAHQAALLPSGKALVAGGVGALTSVEIYNPSTGTWSTTTSLGTGRSDAAATLLPSGAVLFAGGGDASGNAIASVELFTSASPAWSGTGAMAGMRTFNTSTLLPNGKVLTAGGYVLPANTYNNSAELYDSASGNWSGTGNMSLARSEHVAVLLTNGKVLAVGGYNPTNSFMTSTELYDPTAGTWSTSGAMATQRYRFGATLLTNGKVLVSGGGNPNSLRGSELYDPVSGTWSSTGNLIASRQLHTATTLPNGKVLVTGGSAHGYGDTGFTSCEIYDSAAGTWASTGAMATPRQLHSATLLPNGKVLVAGGYTFSTNPFGDLVFSSAEIFDPATGNWSPTGSMAGIRYNHRAVLLPNGKVLVSGGSTGSGLTASAEIYDPATGTWSSAGSLGTARSAHGSTLLPNGKVLIHGGNSVSNTVQASAEVFDSGLGFSPSAQPQISSAISDSLGRFTLAGTGFTGVSGGSSGGFQDSATSYPLVQLRSLGSGQTSFLLPDSGTSMSATAFTSASTAGFPPGQAMLTVFANGIPSSSAMVVVPRPQGIAIEQPAGTGVANGGSKAFGSVLVAATQSLTFTIKNTGDLPLNVSGVNVTGGNAAEFVVDTTGMTTSVNPGTSTTFTVAFTPAAVGTRSTTLQISSDDSVAPAFSIALSGTGANNAPTLSGLSDQTINEDISSGALSFTVGDVETAAGALTLTGASSNTTLVPNANITFGGSGASRTVTVVPAANLNGTATITVTVNDGTTSTNGTFLLTVSAVNDAPTLNAISNPAAILEDAAQQTVNLSGISAGSNESQTLVVTATSDNTALIPNPTVTYTSPSATGSLKYTPVANANGTATITVTVNDGQALNNLITQTFVVTVTAVNDAPTLDVISNPAAILEDAGLQTINLTGITAGGGESQALVVTATSNNTNVIPNPTVSYTSPGTTGSLSYTPVANANGSAIITVTVNDGDVSNNTIVRTFTVNVTSVNDAPTITAISDQTINEDGSTGALSFTVGDVETAAASLTLTRASTNTTLVPLANIVFGGSGTDRTVTVTPTANQNGTATITVTVSDGTTTTNSVFVLTVNAVNDSPTLNAISNPAAILEDAAQQTVNLSGISAGPNESQTITLTATSDNTALIPDPIVTYTSPSATGSLKYTPVANASGTATITVTVNDGQALNNLFTQTFIVTVTAVNDAPTLDVIGNPAAILEDAGLQSVSLTGITAGGGESQALVVTATSNNTNLIPHPSVSYNSPDATGSLSYTPVANANGSAIITVTVNDGQASNNTFIRTFTVSVSAVNDAPTISDIPNQVTNEDIAIAAIPFTIGDIETGATSLTLTQDSSNTTLVPLSNIVFGGSGTSRTVTITPAANQNGTAVITIGVSDGSLTTTDTFVLTVDAVNDAPTITPIASQVITYNTLTSVLGFTLGDVESLPSNLVVTATSSDQTLLRDSSIYLGGSGLNRDITLVPEYNQTGVVAITITVSDGTDTTAMSFALTVNAPEIVVEQPFNNNIPDGGTKDFGNLSVGSSTNLVFFVKNLTASNLTGLTPTLDGPDAAMFSLISNPVGPVAGPNGTTAFTVRFNPTTGGAKTAAIHIASNDPDESPFDITLTGTGMTALDNWRQTNFGSVLNTGNAGNTADPDHDGVSNLLEYAFGSNPLQTGRGQIPQPQYNGNTIVFSFTEPAGVSGVSYTAEWTQTVGAGSWSTAGFSDTGTGTNHVFTLPVNGSSSVFVRIRVSQP
jgi:N-acetylneuraminic acid mutarotase